MAAFHHSLSDFKQSAPSGRDEHFLNSEVGVYDQDYCKSLMYSLQANLQDLKQEANTLKTITFRETGNNSTLQSFRSPEKILDYRKTPVPKKYSEDMKKSEPKPKESQKKPSKPDYPSYGRGIDPPPDIDIGYMKKTATSNNFAPIKKVIYEKNFEKYLTEKANRGKFSEDTRPFFWEEPKIIQYLREEYFRLTRRSENRLLKSALVNELLTNFRFGELFGVTESISENLVFEVVDNIGAGDNLNIDQFLQFYQISKNNLLKSQQVFIDAQAKNSQGPTLKLKIEYLFNKFWLGNADDNSKETFILALQGPLQADIFEILEMPPNLYLSLEEFLVKLNTTTEEITTDLLLSLFKQEEVVDFVLPEHILQACKEEYDKLLIEDQPGVNTSNLIENLMGNEVIQSNFQTVARSPQGLPSISEETLSDLLTRIQTEAPEWLTWEEFVRYFSIEGRPLEDEPIVQTENKPPLGCRYSITVPEPFKFMSRETIKQPSIRERRLKEMLQAEDEEIDKELLNKFKAKPVPPEVKIPMYDRIMKEQEDRRVTLKARFEAITKSLERPFSFYYRDMSKPEIKAEEAKIHVFHANPVPWFCKVAAMTKFEKENAMREDRIFKQAKESLAHSRMPPRMEEAAKREKEKEIEDKKREKFIAKSQKYKFTAKEVPDFRTLQEKFLETLLSKKQGYTPTVPQPFGFHESQKSQEALRLLDFQAQALQNWASKAKIVKRAVSAFAKPKVVPSITQKTKDMMACKREYMEIQKEKQEEKLQEEELRKIKHQAMLRLMKNAGTLKKCSRKDDEKERLKERKKEMLKNELEYKLKLQEISEKIHKRPFLIDQVASGGLSRKFESEEQVRSMLNQEYISEAVTSQEQEVSNESFG